MHFEGSVIGGGRRTASERAPLVSQGAWIAGMAQFPFSVGRGSGRAGGRGSHHFFTSSPFLSFLFTSYFATEVGRRRDEGTHDGEKEATAPFDSLTFVLFSCRRSTRQHQSFVWCWTQLPKEGANNHDTDLKTITGGPYSIMGP